jgi:hypothetical protein
MRTVQSLKQQNLKERIKLETAILDLKGSKSYVVIDAGSGTSRRHAIKVIFVPECSLSIIELKYFKKNSTISRRTLLATLRNSH